MSDSVSYGGAGNMLPLIQLIRSVSFGGLLLGGVAGLLQMLIAPSLPFTEVVVVGSLLGTAAHQAIAKWWLSFVEPLFSWGRNEVELRKLLGYHQRGLVSQQQFVDLARQIVERDVLGK